jgi:hypothetical protein
MNKKVHKITPVFIEDEKLLVKPIKDDDIYDSINIDPAFPQHPFLAYIPGPTSAGKSTVCQFLIAEPYNKFFDKIFIISATIKKDRSWKKFKFDPDRVFEFYTDDTFRQIVNEIEGSEDEKCLIIIDDMTAQNIFNGNNELCRFIAVHRHSPAKYPPNICGTSLIVISHQYKAIQPKMRGLMSEILVFKLRSDEELDAIMDDCKGLELTRKEFREMYLTATKGKYNFLYIKKKDENPFRINFNIILKIEEEIIM